MDEKIERDEGDGSKRQNHREVVMRKTKEVLEMYNKKLEVKMQKLREETACLKRDFQEQEKGLAIQIQCYLSKLEILEKKQDEAVMKIQKEEKGIVEIEVRILMEVVTEKRRGKKVDENSNWPLSLPLSLVPLLLPPSLAPPLPPPKPPDITIGETMKDKVELEGTHSFNKGHEKSR